MSEGTPTYRPGDVVNGYRLTEQDGWVPDGSSRLIRTGKTRPWWIIGGIGFVIAVLFGVGLLLGGDATERPGSPDVYQQIESLTNCAALQTMFDQAAANNDRERAGTPMFDITRSYMEAADDRLEQVGCYG